MATKLPPDEYKQLHQRVCKLLYAGMQTTSPAEEATKLLAKVDESTRTKEEFLDTLEKRLQRLQDPVGWITQKRERLEQICAKIDHRKRSDPDLESRFSGVGKLGLAIIRRVVSTPVSELGITNEDLNKVHICMAELKNIVGDTITNNNGTAAAVAVAVRPTQTIAPPITPMEVPQRTSVQVLPQNIQPQSSVPGSLKRDASSLSISSQPLGPGNPIPSRAPSEPPFEDGVFGIIIIELQSLLKKMSEKPSKFTINTFINKYDNLLSLLTGWSSKNGKHLDKSYQARIDCSTQIIASLIEQLQSLPVEETASIDVIWQHQSVVKTLPLTQMMVDETVQFEVKRLSDRHFDAEGFMKRRRLDPEFQRRITELFQSQMKKLHQEAAQVLTEEEKKSRNLHLNKIINVYNESIDGAFITNEQNNLHSSTSSDNRSDLFGGIVNII